jgi:hypothetical protein
VPNEDQNASGGPEDTEIHQPPQTTQSTYIIYTDFEALTTKIKGVELDPAKSNTQKTQHHETCGFGYVVVRCDGHTEAPVIYRGPDAATRFLEHLSREETKIKRTLSNPAPM